MGICFLVTETHIKESSRTILCMVKEHIGVTTENNSMKDNITKARSMVKVSFTSMVSHIVGNGVMVYIVLNELLSKIVLILI